VRAAIMKTCRAVVKAKATLAHNLFQNGRDERAMIWDGEGGARSHNGTKMQDTNIRSVSDL
jgi:hypothetical protein